MPEPVVEVTNKTGTCTGLIAELEATVRGLPVGARVSAQVPDIPTRVDVLAWVGRKGHQVVSDQRDGPTSRLVIQKVTGSPAPGTATAR